VPGGLAEALRSARGALLSPWNRESLAVLADANLPDLPMRSAWLLEADVRAVWLRWLVEGAVPVGSSPRNVALLAAELISSAEDMLAEVTPLLNQVERRAAAHVMAEIAFAWITAESGKRVRLSKSEKRLILLAAGHPVRCWICGSQFSERAIERYLGELDEPFVPAAFVDCFYPRGIHASDYECQVEHVTPVAAGGTNDSENLRLACGYCNKIKRESLDIYARSSTYNNIIHPALGRLRLPNPYWVCRLMAVDGTCSVCACSSRDTAIRAGPARLSSYVNPSNLRLYCADHDPFLDVRWIPSSSFRTA
jgi:hypothetical protein